MLRPLCLISTLALGLAGATAHGAAPQACRLPGLAHQVLCGRVQRPLDPDRPDGPTIDVRYAIVPALARHKLPDPVVLLAGGPGQSAIDLAPAVLPLLGRLNNRRDLVFIDQRGTGRSAPLGCPAVDVEPIARRFDTAVQQRLLAECRETLGRTPPLTSPEQLRLFTTTIAMADFDAVRRALGVGQVNLIGASYGTRAALEWHRQQPAAIRRMVLDGVAPPDMALPDSMSIDSQRALDAVFDACGREAACQSRYPRLRAEWDRLLGELPQPADLRDPLTGQTDHVRIERDTVLGFVRAALYLPTTASVLPAAIDAATHGRFEPLAALATMLQARPGRRDPTGGIAAGMHFSVVCSEDVPRLDAVDATRAGRDFGVAMRGQYQAICADWPRGSVDPAFYRIVPATSAVLLLSGGLDPATPPRHAQDARRQLGAKATLRVVAHAGHGVMSIGCMRDVVFRFIDASDDDAARAVDSRCAEAIPRPPAFIPPAASATR